MHDIAGATGNTGKVAANLLLDRGKKVRVIVREVAKGAPFAARGAEVAVADLGDEKALTKALDGAEGAYVLVPPKMNAPNFRAYQDATTTAIVGAVRASKVPHVVLLSSVGAERESGTGPIAGLHIAEQKLGALADTQSTFIRAGYFMENVGAALGALEQGIFPSFLPADLPIDMIATRDIGELAATLLIEGPAKGVVNLGGPAVTMRQVAAALSEIVGKTIPVVEAPLDGVVPTLTGFGFTEDLAGLYRQMIGSFAAGELTFEKQHRRVQGKTPIQTVLRGLLGKG
ncbi:MAG: NmrA family NAD(P)-binding protein [Polyangiaceae bacterium]|nr:NmrA family NAD(P)-binding protein [Polyangiaceae bacterium]